MFSAIIQRDIRTTLRHKGQALSVAVFFILAVLLYPLSLGPEPEILQRTAPGLLMIAALFASMLPLDQLFGNDKHDGTLDALLLSPSPLAFYVGARLTGQWLFTGLPLVILGPLMAFMLELPVYGSVLLVLFLTSLLFNLIGGIASALTLGTRRGSVLLALLVMPLYIPVLIFGAGALDLARMGLDNTAPLLFLGAMLAINLPLAPPVIAAILKLQIRE